MVGADHGVKLFSGSTGVGAALLLGMSGPTFSGQRLLPSLGRLWDRNQDGELVSCRPFCSDEEEARCFNPQGSEGQSDGGTARPHIRPNPPPAVQSHKHEKMTLGLAAEGEPPATASPAPVLRRARCCPPLCSRNSRSPSKGGSGEGLISGPGAPDSGVAAAVGALGRPQPTVTLKPQWNRLRQ